MKGPGIVLLIPIVDRPVRIDLREQFIEVPSQTTITKDNAPINVDFLIYWRIVDPMRSIVNVANFAGALQGVATTTLRAVIGDILLDEVLSRREQINEILRTKLDEVTERWGGKVTTVEIREITPPRDVQDAMNRQLSAERTRRAVITESEGRRQSEINVAEGAKQATILAAEGDRQSRILRAEGERQSAILNAEGYSQALERIYAAASQVDQKTMAIQYLEALKALGASPSTKFVLPLELSRLVESVSAMVDDGMRGRGGRPAVGRPAETADRLIPAPSPDEPWPPRVPPRRGAWSRPPILPPTGHGDASQWKAHPGPAADRERSMAPSILVVDDDPNVQRLLSYTLRQEGFEVGVVADGAEALRAWETSRPALILLDVMLPKLDGYAVAQRIREDEAGASHTPDHHADGRG